MERHGRSDEAASLVVPVLPEVKPPPEKDVPECRLCEDFPVFFKNFDFHKHLADVHFRTQLNNNLPQVRLIFECILLTGDILGQYILARLPRSVELVSHEVSVAQGKCFTSLSCFRVLPSNVHLKVVRMKPRSATT